MRQTLLAAAAAFAGVLVTGTGVMQVRAQADLIKFPEKYAEGVLYGSVDRSDNKQHREFYITKNAIAAVKAGKALPSGTVITMVNYKAKLDDKGVPVKGPDGRFIKTDIAGFAVMEKRDGWGKQYPDNIRNGEWEYQAFTSNKAVNAGAKLENCFTCHKPKESEQFLFSLDQLKKTAAK